MNIDSVVLILNLCVMFYCFYEWRKSKDREFVWVSMLSIFVVLLIIWNYIINNFFYFSENIKLVSNTFVHYSWLLIIIAVIIIIKKEFRK